MRQNITGISPFEPIIGFSRAVRVGNTIHVSGTGPVGANRETPPHKRAAFSRSFSRPYDGGATLNDVVRTRMFLTRVEDWETVGRIHGEFFGKIRPAATMVVVAGLLNPSWCIEIEADAIIQSAETPNQENE